MFVGNVSGWQVSNVLYMNQFVRDCALFNVDLSQWDVRNLLKMYQAFKGATAFNGDVSTWQTDSLTDMSAAFADCPNFNRDLSQWHVSLKHPSINFYFIECMFLHLGRLGDDVWWYFLWCVCVYIRPVQLGHLQGNKHAKHV